MPSPRHEGLVELVRQHPPLAIHLARITGAFDLPGEVTAYLGSEDMSDVAPPSSDPDAKPQKYTADAVAVVTDASGKRLVALIVEPQGREDDDKDEAWPCYVANARRANKCPAATLIVLCWSETAAAKCRRIINTGHLGFDLAPWVLGPGDIPEDGDGDPYLVLCAALLDTRSLDTEAGCHRVLQAIIDTGAKQSDRDKLTKTMLGVANDASRKRLEDLMSVSYQSPFIDGWEAKGRAEGEASMKAKDLLEILEERDLKLTKKQRAKITPNAGLDQLNTWFRRAITASSADEVFSS